MPDCVFVTTLHRTNTVPGHSESDRIVHDPVILILDWNHRDLLQTMTFQDLDTMGNHNCPFSITPPRGSLQTICGNQIAPCAKQGHSSRHYDPGLGFCIPVLRCVGFALQLATFYIVLSARHAEGSVKGTVYLMPDPKFQTTLFLADLVSQNQISSQ